MLYLLNLYIDVDYIDVSPEPLNNLKVYDYIDVVSPESLNNLKVYDYIDVVSPESLNNLKVNDYIDVKSPEYHRYSMISTPYTIIVVCSLISVTWINKRSNMGFHLEIMLVN